MLRYRGAADITYLGTMVPGVSIMALFNTFPLNEISVPYFGVPLTVIAMAAGGALVSFAYGQPEKSRKKLYITAAANTFLAAIFVALIPRIFGWEWSVPKLEPALAAGVAWIARWAVPSSIKLIPEILRKLFRLGPESDEKEYGPENDRRHASKYDKYLRSDDEDNA